MFKLESLPDRAYVNELDLNTFSSSHQTFRAILVW